MDVRIIDLNRSLYDLCKDYPELPDILDEVGFKDITKPGMLATAGRLMTIPKGAAMKKINLDDVKVALVTNGYEIK
ncbi:MAG TPA: DUF1858 domain-containing protein [Mobilitalea sp.]|nr:DUF1858 domain-containing protein [Mobilitalea sp.]